MSDTVLLQSVFGFAAVVLVLGGFELFQHIAILEGEIPKRGTHTLMGKPFLHWDYFKVQRIGDLIGLSFMDGCVAVAWRRVVWTNRITCLVAVMAVLACAATVLWVVSVQRQFAAGKFNRWDWGFTYPAGRLTIAGGYHLVYFGLEAMAIGCVLVFLFLPVGGRVKFGMGVGLGIWIATAIWDAVTIGLSGGPFAGPKQFGPSEQRVRMGETKPGLH